MTNKTRKETDSLGAIDVPAEALWGAQTQRAIINFSIGENLIPIEIIHALAKVKHASAKINHRLGVLEKEKSDLIIQISNEISKGLHDSQFPLMAWQSGSGTQSNMNMNEVISNLGSLYSGSPLGSHKPLHPNDDVNRSQSTNDTFPTAIHIAVVQEIQTKLIPEINLLCDEFSKKSNDWKGIVKTGRTHLQDAVPLTLGQEVSAWKDQIETAKKRVENSLEELYLLPIGGTAVGTGINSPIEFGKQAVEEISSLTELPFISAPNKFALMSSHDGLINTMSQLKLLAVSLLKIFNDIRLLSSGPRTGLSEINLPENEPGSSIMPGKINPTQCEAMSMVCMQVMGLEASVSMAGSNGHLQMNSSKPLIGLNLLQSIKLIHDASRSCRTKMIKGLTPNLKKIKDNLDNSLMLVTALTPKIGYEKASKIAQHAHKKGLTLKEASLQLKYISESEFESIINPNNMINPEKL